MELTKGEIRVLNQIGKGNSNRSISEILNIGIRTVETHRFNISKKLGISGAPLVIYAYKSLIGTK